MSRTLRRLAWAAAALAGLTLVALAAGYAATDAPAVLRTVAADPSLPSASVRGVRLHVRTFGDPKNPTVVVLHGGPGNDSRYLLPLSALADRYFVVFYDQRGGGLSERVDDGKLTLDGFYDELDGIVDLYSGGRPVRLVGHSWGAMLASGYLARHPAKVRQAVLAEPGMLTPETAALLMRATNGMRPPMSAGAAWAAAKAWLESLHVRGPDPDARRDYFMGALMKSDIEGHPIAGYFCGRSLRTARLDEWRFGARVAPALLGRARRGDGSWNVDFVNGVDRFRGDVLFLAGTCNELTGEVQQRRHMRSFPKADLVVIPGAGHTMFGEKPEESVAAVRTFFERAR